jgi:hypothetical protein
MHRGWAVLLCVYLLGWVPLNYATELLATVPSLGMRGTPAVVELVARGLVTILCATAGWMVWTSASGSWPIAMSAIVAAAAASIQSLFWTVLPRNVAPGDKWPLGAVVLVHMIFWLVLIGTARRRDVS